MRVADPAPTAPAVAIDGTGGWAAAPAAAVVIDRSGTIRALNEAAHRLFPDAGAGVPAACAVADWLATAHDRGSDEGVRGEVGERAFAAHPVPHGEAVTW